MAQYFNAKDSIECASAEIWTKKVGSRSPVHADRLGLCIKCNCDRDASSEIIKELKPKKAIYNSAAHLHKGDILKSRGLFFYIKGVSHPKFKPEEGHTHRHGSQRTNTNSHTYSEITKPFEHIAKALEKKLLKQLRTANT